jgi:D-3-phosphoglycerate dehydrogenase
MPRFKVAVLSLGYESYETEREILSDVDAELILAQADCLTEEEVIASGYDADAIMVREAPVTAHVLDSLPRCRAVVRYGVGVDNIDLERASEKRIYVANVPGYGNEEVSDHAAALLLACIRTLPARERALRQGRFETDISEQIYRTSGKTLGLVGYGAIGRVFLRKWRGFDPGRVLVCDPALSVENAAADGLELTDQKTLLSQSDYVSLHLPLTEATRGIIDEAALRSMKPTAILINTARGGIVDEAALARALEKGWILAAGLDVFDREPLPPDSPLLGVDNLILTGHVGWYSKDSVRELQTRAAREVIRVLTGSVPEHWVNPW